VLSHPLRDLVWIAAFAAGAVVSAHPTGGIEIRNGWIYESGTGQSTEAFVEIENHTAKPVTLVAAAVDGAGAVELRKPVAGKPGTSERVTEIAIGADKALALEPGGMHLAVLDLDQPFRTGMKTRLTVGFRGGTKKQLMIEVRKRPAAPSSK
jgi:copper(I)-binding protein